MTGSPQQPMPIRAALEELFQGELEPYARMMLFSADPRGGLSCAALRDPVVLDERLAHFGAAFPGADRRAVASFWSQYYFAVLTIPLGLSMVVLGRMPDPALETTDLVWDPSGGGPSAIRFRDERGTPERPVTDLFETMIEAHLAPMIAAIAAHAGLAPKLLWSNVAGYFEWIVQEMHRRRSELTLAARGAAIDEAVAFFDCAVLPSGTRNPLLKPVRYVEEGGEIVRRRRICCLRHMLPGVGGCGATCPVPEGRGATA
ncbi:siderophore-iron reductase FhuF [Segnochrobactrum spirostomi]|uniref:Siderophore-iron reductase FhuF n=1 Tax=Segnochrobactrum spirostomi TaxID=2608987 RepID=A0A6A7Y8N2_9HYPH|nr:siderophore-iron reductase FhuF [Segnochrobactrum spirostomi]MQT15085.1 siderophore-iron reductase FhuF [Segnochrobactrum spirostomi]